jgi:thiol-disulfide isomerase/thioredoxin
MTMLIRASLLALAMGAGLTGATDLNGHPVMDLAPAGARAVVLFFAASDCPISNRYIPDLQRLAKQFEPLGVRVWFVYPNPGDDAKVVRAHDLEFAITANTALDKSQSLTRMAQVTVTPEAAVFVPQGTSLHEVYRGRIDDRYLPWETSGRKRCIMTSKKPSAPCLLVSLFRSPRVRRLAVQL